MPPHDTDNHLIEEGLRHHRCGRMHEAEFLYREFLQRHPDNHVALHLLGVLAGQTGRREAGIGLIEQAILLNSAVAAYHNNLGNLFRECGRAEEAIQAYRRAIKISPEYAEAYANLGHVLSREGRSEEAIGSYRCAVELKPEWIDVLVNLADCLRDAGQLLDAEATYRSVLDVAPESHGIRNNLGTVLRDLGRANEGIEQYERVLRVDANAAETWNNLGVAMADCGRLGEAAKAFRQAIARRPDYADAHANLGATLYSDRKPAEAIVACRHAVELEPQNAKARSNLGMVLLGCGEYEQGWAEHEWRYRCNPKFAPRGFRQPQWDGRPLGGQTILLHAEQGFGDTIQFCRFAPETVKRGGRVILEVQRELVRLLRNSMPEVEVVARGQPLPDFDFHCPLLSLPFALGTTLTSLPNWQYLKAAADCAPWKRRGSAVQIGLVWAGRPTHTNDRNRSSRLAQLAPLSQITGIEFHSLQRGPAARQLEEISEFHPVEHRLDGLDFAGTAALIATLDLVISVDTAVAHLAAAMGKPVWLLLPYAADWRWMLDRDDSPWYPTMRLFRQQRWGEWDGVIRRVIDELGVLCASGPPTTSSTPASPSSSA